MIPTSFRLRRVKSWKLATLVDAGGRPAALMVKWVFARVTTWRFSKKAHKYCLIFFLILKVTRNNKKKKKLSRNPNKQLWREGIQGISVILGGKDCFCFFFLLRLLLVIVFIHTYVHSICLVLFFYFDFFVNNLGHELVEIQSIVFVFGFFLKTCGYDPYLKTKSKAAGWLIEWFYKIRKRRRKNFTYILYQPN